jgi:hypothetical protein
MRSAKKARKQARKRLLASLRRELDLHGGPLIDSLCEHVYRSMPARRVNYEGIPFGVTWGPFGFAIHDPEDARARIISYCL